MLRRCRFVTARRPGTSLPANQTRGVNPSRSGGSPNPSKKAYGQAAVTQLVTKSALAVRTDLGSSLSPKTRSQLCGRRTDSADVLSFLRGVTVYSGAHG